MKYDYWQSECVADYDDGMKGTMPKSILGTPTPYTFEEEQVLGVEQADTYLTRKYGNYMVIPDVAHQRQHNFHYLDLNSSYRSSAQ